jgi:hypothetical protein
MIIVMAQVQTNGGVATAEPPYEAICLPKFSYSRITDVVNSIHADTLHIRFTNGGRWIRPDPPSISWQDGDQSMCREVTYDQNVGVALIEGANRSMQYLRMRLRGVETSVVLRIGQPQVLYLEPVQIMDVLTGGLAK